MFSLSNSEDGLVRLVRFCAYPYEGMFFTKGLLRGICAVTAQLPAQKRMR